MASGSRCMSGNTCGCRVSWTYRWAVMVPRINTRGDRVFQAMAPYTIIPAVGVVCLCKVKAGLRLSPRGSPLRQIIAGCVCNGFMSTESGIPGTIFQQDNARLPVVKTIRDFCSAQHMQLLPRPAYSPDMSPNEHVWDLVGRRLVRDPRPAASKA
ncbi:transposable element Tcb2 transposase [Trichonephila clavipes]|nr:transposable element Tcb2 transposase [Trichonephila clavipes]